MLALALLLAQLGAAAHFAVARHAVCADHGEVIHPDEGAEQDHSSAPAARTDGPALAVTSGHAGHGHEHCGLTAHRRAAVVEAGGSVLEQPNGLTVPVGPAATLAVAFAGIFRLAPKQSPPA